MDFVDINYHDYLAECAENIDFDYLFVEGYPNHILSHMSKPRYERNPTDKKQVVKDKLCFTLGDNYVLLYDGVFEIEPYTEMLPGNGRLTTLVLTQSVRIKDGKLKGKMLMCSSSGSPVNTEYEINVKNTEMRMTIELCINGDGFGYEHINYEFPTVNLSFMYKDNSKLVSAFDKIESSTERQTLEQYLLEYFTRGLRTAVKNFQLEELDIKQTVSEKCGNDYSLRNLLRIHCRKLHKAFNDLTKKIISITKEKMSEKMIELKFPKMYGYSDKNKTLQTYTCIIKDLNNLEIMDRNVMVKKKEDSVLLYIPVQLKIEFHFRKAGSDSEEENQTFSSQEDHIKISLRKLSETKVSFHLIDYKINYLRPTENYDVTLSVDHQVLSVIEKTVKSFILQALEPEELHELALKSDVEIEYCDDDFEAEDSDNE